MKNADAKIRLRGIDPSKKGAEFFKTMKTYLNAYPVSGTTKDWINVSKRFNSGVYNMVEITLYAFATPGTVWFDDVEIVEIKESESHPTGIVIDGDFEKHGEWNFTSYSKEAVKGKIDEEEGYEASGLKVFGNGSGVWEQIVQIKRSTHYKISLMYRGSIEKGYAYLKISAGGGSGRKGIVLVDERVKGTTPWFPLTKTFFSGEFTKIKIGLGLFGKGEVWFDNVNLEGEK